MPKKKKSIAPRTPNRAGYQVQDVWFHRAKAAGYRARSAFKLLEIQEKYHLIQPGDIVLDLGCAPGSWMQVISKIVGETGLVLGIDLQVVEKFPNRNIVTQVGDMTSPEVHRSIKKFLQDMSLNTAGSEDAGIAPISLSPKKSTHHGKFDIITSDVAPKTTGRNDDDQYHSAMLCMEVLRVANFLLKRGGNLVMKVFVGRDLGRVTQEAKNMFTQVACIKPSACRDRSFEEYVVCLGKR